MLFLKLLNSERIKAFSLRSTYIQLILLAGATIGYALVYSIYAKPSDKYDFITHTSTLQTVFGDNCWREMKYGITFAAIILIVFAVLNATNEFTSGQISASLLAAPNRFQFLAAKLVFIAIFSFIVSAIAMLLSFFVLYFLQQSFWPVFPSFTEAFTDHFFEGFIGVVLGLTLISVISASLGIIFTSSAGALAVSLIFIATSFFSGLFLILNRNLLQSKLAAHIYSFLPDHAFERSHAIDLPYIDESANVSTIQEATITYSTDGMPQYITDLSAAQAVIVLLVWCIIAAAAASLLFQKRDV